MNNTDSSCQQETEVGAAGGRPAGAGVGVGEWSGYHWDPASPLRCHHTPSSKTSDHSRVCVHKMWAFWSMSVVADSWWVVMAQEESIL